MTIPTSPFRDTERVLDAVACRSARAAARADVALQRMLRDIEASPCPDHAWTTSRLTGDGYPVEFTFATRDDAIRYTVAPWPDEPPRARLALACDVICELGSHPVPEDVADALLQLSVGSDEPEHGAWVGGRHADDEAAPDRFKLYVQAVAGAEPGPALARVPAPVLEAREVQLRLYGYEPGRNVHERYFHAPGLRRYEVRPLLRSAGLEHRTQELVELVSHCCGRPIGERIPGGSVGFSLAGPLEQPAAVFTLFVFARALWGGDRRIRLALARLALERGWALDTYQRASEPLAGRDVYATYHGMAGFVVEGEKPIDVAIGLRPPPVHACG
jgi:hypothetical protein